MVASSNESADSKIVTLLLDPGHGGEDSGASANNVVEKVEVLQLAVAAKFALSKSDPACRVYLTRDLDTHPSFKQRADSAKTFRADLVVSIHCNASNNPDAHGLWLFHRHNCSTSKKLCDAIAGAPPSYFRASPVRIFDAYNDPSHPGDVWLQRPEHVLERYNVPAILVEYGFVTNPNDANYLRGAAPLADFTDLLGVALREFRRSGTSL